MNASSYLEGFLTVYGWMLYDTLYQLFSMLWLVFLPFAFHGYNFFRETITDDFYGSYGYFKSNFFQFIVMLFILILCVIPIDKISIKEAKVNTVCTKGEAISKYYDNKKSVKNQFKFNVEKQGKVPVLPSLVMRLAQGTNNVIYRTTPCVANVSNLALAFDTSQVRDEGLKNEMNEFVNQCYKKASSRLTTYERMVGEGPVNELAEGFAKKYVKDDLHKSWEGISYWFSDVSRSREIATQKRYMGSRLMLYLMDADANNLGTGLNYIEDANAQKAFKQLVEAGSIKSNTPVTGVPTSSNDLSKNQATTGVAPVKCGVWWKKLKPKLEQDVLKDLARNSIAEDKSKSCTQVAMIKASLSAKCTKAIKSMHIMTTPAEYQAKIDDLLLKSQYTHTGNAVLSNGETRTLDAVGTAAFLGTLVGFVPQLNNNLLANITESAVSFYGEMFMYKIIIKFLQPMLLMGIYAFWGIYLIVSSYRGETVFKGLVLIFAITLLPSIWAIADHLDGHLYQALFPYNDVKDATTRDSSTVERMILDGASTVFYIIFPFILMFMISEAGGPRGHDAIGDIDRQSKGRFPSGLGKGAITKTDPSHKRSKTKNS